LKEIKAYVRPDLVDSIVEQLEKAGVQDLTVIRVDAIGPLADPDDESRHWIRKYREKYSAIAKLELICNDNQAKHFIEIIRQTAHTGASGDGRIFWTNVDGAVNIRTGVEGERAL
jgi:nitrogen regulatory protein P-II 1